MNIEERQGIEGRSLLLFDGRCAMCNGLVRWLIRRDSGRKLIYAPLESSLGREMVVAFAEKNANAPLLNSDGIIFFEAALTAEPRVSAKSDAAIRVLRLLPGGWPWLGRMLSWVPRGLREWLYRCVARWRYRLFGAYDACSLPSAAEKELIFGTVGGSGH